MDQTKTADQILNLDLEYRFYNTIIRDLIKKERGLTQEHKLKLLPWLNKLHSPELSATILREKRNRYLLMMCIMMLTKDPAKSVFNKPPPEDMLPDIHTLKGYPMPLADWETDTTWDEILFEKEEMDKFDVNKSRLSKKRQGEDMRCLIHYLGACPTDTELDHLVGQTLDKQFKFFLYIGKPFAALLPHATERTLAGKWLQTLCTVNKNSCAVGKGIRNDYMMCLLGYLSNKRLMGPFQEHPVSSQLAPLCQAAKMCADKRPILDPTHPRAEQFLKDLPYPEEGAFAFVSLTGDLYDNKL